MNALLNQLFGLDSMGFGDEGVRFEFARPLEAWVWALAVLAILAFAGWSYWRLIGPIAARGVLAVIRALALIIVLVLLLGPQLVKPNDRVERDWVLVLVDRTESLTVADVDTPTGRVAREQQLVSAIQTNRAMWGKLASERNVLWLGFAGGAFDLDVIEDEGAFEGIDIGEPDGRRTAIGASIEQALRRVAARPVSGVVMLTDGRSVDEPTRAAMRRLQNELIPVISVPLGSPEPVTDLAIRRVDAPTMAFIDDVIPVSVRIDRNGGDGARGRVELVDDATGVVLDEKALEGGDGSETVTLTTRPKDAGNVRWSVRVVTDTPDLVEANNSAPVELELVDRPLRVVYFDGYPRWEYRYLKNLLLRERSILSSVLLLAADREYIQEGDIELTTLPRSPEEWGEFDVIVLGDLRAELFSEEQLEQIREHVAVRGGGLLWIAGPGATPGSWRGSPMSDLIPFVAGASTSDSAAEWGDPVMVSRAPEAERLGLLRLGESEALAWPELLTDPNAGWSSLRWAQRIPRESVKPTADTLALATPLSGAASEPLVLTMRYGAGRVIYVATDEIWRWRYARGEPLPERFWLPLMRYLGRESLSRTGKLASIEVAPSDALVGQPIRVALRLLDQSLVDARPETMDIVIRRESASGEPGAPVRLTLGPEDVGAGLSGPAVGSFSTTWLASEPGTYLAEADDALVAGLDLAVEFEVSEEDDELRNPDADHAFLERLAAQTEGATISPSALGTLPTLLPNRELTIAGAPDVVTLWDRPPFLAILVLLLTIEWVWRKLIRLA